jgi:hypothetical protein
LGSRFGRFTYRCERKRSRVRAEQEASSAEVSRDRPVRWRASDRRWKVISVESERDVSGQGEGVRMEVKEWYSERKNAVGKGKDRVQRYDEVKCWWF